MSSLPVHLILTNVTDLEMAQSERAETEYGLNSPGGNRRLTLNLRNDDFGI